MIPFAQARAAAADRLLTHAAIARRAGRDDAAMDAKIRAAAMRAPLAYPGPIGHLLADELDAYARMSFLWGSHRMTRIMDDVLAKPVPLPDRSR